MLSKCGRCGGQLLASRWDAGAMDCVQCGRVEYGADVAVADRRIDNWRGNVHMVKYVGDYKVMKHVRVKTVLTREGSDGDNGKRDMFRKLLQVSCPWDGQRMHHTSQGKCKLKGYGASVCYTCSDGHIVTMRTSIRDMSVIKGWA